MKRIFPIFLCMVVLTGCWSNQELDTSALVFGIGLRKIDDKLRISFEVISPGGPTNQRSGSEGGDEKINHYIIEKDADSILQGARESIRYSKRRLFFDHARVWVINEKLAREGFIDYLDIARRDQMFRINSFVFITKNNPTEILSQTTLYDSLPSIEIVSALDQTEYISEFPEVKLYDFFRLIEGAMNNGYLPIIQVEKTHDKTITTLDGTAVIKKDKMVGKLTVYETIGLNVLRNRQKSGYITIPMENGEKLTIEITNTKTKIDPKLVNNKLKANIMIKFKGTISENYTVHDTGEKWVKKVEATVAKKIKKDVQRTLKVLQKELKTDISGIGIETYRKYPRQWTSLKKDWDDIFANAEINIDVRPDIYHPGLVNRSANYHHQPRKNPFKFIK